MEQPIGGSDAVGIRTYLGVLRRHRWIVLLAAVLVPLSAVYASLQQTPQYQATSEVVLKYQNLAGVLSGIQDYSNVYQDASRVAETQARVAREPVLAERVVRAAGANARGRTADDLLASSEVSVESDADVLAFTVTDTDPALAERLATAYARQYVSRRLELDTEAVVLARQSLQERLKELRDQGRAGSALYDRLVESEQQLRTMETLQTSNASLLRPADDAVQVSPQPVRNGLLGAFLGILLGVGFAFLREALDTRVRSAEDVGDALGVPLLARIPPLPRARRRRSAVPALERPSGHSAEAFRVLRTNLEFVSVDRPFKVLMVTSAAPEEGKTTTAANLAVALARSGRRVVLAELDLRRPALAARFGLPGRPGLTDVALGHRALEDALVPVPLADGPQDLASRVNGNGNGNGTAAHDGVLHVLTSGPLPPDPGEFVASAALGRVLAQLRNRFDVVVLDVPPLLGLGDALRVSSQVDAAVLVARLGLLRRPMLKELTRLVGTMPAPVLGFVLFGEAGSGTGYGYGYGYGYEQPAERKKPLVGGRRSGGR